MIIELHCKNYSVVIVGWHPIDGYLYRCWGCLKLIQRGRHKRAVLPTASALAKSDGIDTAKLIDKTKRPISAK